jgi:transposase
MPTAAALLLPRGYRVRSVSTDGAATLVNAVTTRRSARCPLCRRRSRHVHSGYWRTLLDLPAHGHTVSVRVQVRRFFCRAKSCPRSIFAERLADLAGPHARRTDRLKGDLQHVGFVLGGRPGARLAQHMQMPTSRTTLLRLVAAAPLPEEATPRALGVDDWAFLRCHRYGTILVDLQTHRSVDLLAERTAEALAGWLHEHRLEGNRGRSDRP